MLGKSPGIGHYHLELLSRKYRFWNFYSYVVAYVWEARPIQVISIVHGARNLAVFFSLRVTIENGSILTRQPEPERHAQNSNES